VNASDIAENTSKISMIVRKFERDASLLPAAGKTVPGLIETRHSELSKHEFLARALLLRVPGFARAKRAADLFCTPMPGTRARSLGADLAGFAPIIVRTADAAYQAYVFGDTKTQPYILCAHGWSSFGLRFTPWGAAARAAGYALVSFDHTAHGRSDGKQASFASFVEGINAMRDVFGAPAAGIGHSFGAAAMAMAAAEHGLRCPLVLIAPPADLMVAIRFFTFRVKLPTRMAVGIANELSARLARDVREYAAKYSTGKVRQRVLVIHDVADCDVSWSAGAQFAMLAPNARLLTTTGFGHHRILNDAATLDAALAHIRGATPHGEKLLVSNLDLQVVLAC
jgi:pimeloyl-ACP methyl ester carboxylesterase